MSQKGQTLIELLITIALAAILIPALLTGFSLTREGRAQQEQRLQATAYLKEGQEAVRIVHSNGWNNLTNGTYYPEISGSTWALTSGSENINSNLTRQIEISDVYRDINGDIVQIGGTLDPSTKRVETSVAWNNPLPTSVGSIQFLTRYKNTSYVETTEEDFTAGVLLGTAVTNSQGGEIILGAGGHGDWCSPSEFIVEELDLPQGSTARDVKSIEGKSFTGTSGPSGEFVEISVSNADPPIASIESTISGYDTRDVFIDDNYAYIATGDISRDVVIIDLNTGQEVGYFNDTAWFGSAQGIFVIGNVGYASIGLFVHTFDLSSKIGARPELDRQFLWGTGYRLYVVDDYAYVAVDWGSSELRLVNVSNPNNMSLGARANVNGSRGQEVFINDTGTRAYLVTAKDGSRSEFFIINTDFSSNDKNNSSFNLPIIGEYEANGMSPTGINVVPGNKALLVGTNGEEYQVIDITTETNPQRCGGTNVDSGIYGISAVLEADQDAYSYIVTGDSSQEFKIIEGGPGGSYSDEGTFESSYFDATESAVFNNVNFTSITPTQTAIDFQIAIANAVSDSCNLATYSFIGPDGTSNTFFATPSAIPIIDNGQGFVNPGRCMKYRAFFTTQDPFLSPTLNDFSVNYSQ